MALLRLRVVISGGPRRKHEQQPCIGPRAYPVLLSRIERHERSRIAFRGFAGALDRDSARDDLHDCPLADAVITDLLPVRDVEDNDPALG